MNFTMNFSTRDPVTGDCPHNYKWRYTMPTYSNADSRLSLEQFQERVSAIKPESTDREIEEYKSQGILGPEFVYLGSRGKIDYGISKIHNLKHQEEDPSYDQRYGWPIWRVYGLHALPQWPEDAVSSTPNCKKMTKANANGPSTQEGVLSKESRDPNYLGWDETNDIPRDFSETINSIPQEIIIERMLQIGTLFTWTDEDKWSQTRFSVVKSINDSTFWIISRRSFIWEDYEDYVKYDYAQPHQRVVPLDGFLSPIAFARLKGIDEESFEGCQLVNKDLVDEDDVGVELALRPPHRDYKHFDLEQIYTGAYFLKRHATEE
ncbi:MAG: hypothetical protein M1820_003086 [Bogoriella megaspora]|nr:MAG: hypothetical protein M1820_003086 [Bogoriella megaspora]